MRERKQVKTFSTYEKMKRLGRFKKNKNDSIDNQEQYATDQVSNIEEESFLKIIEKGSDFTLNHYRDRKLNKTRVNGDIPDSGVSSFHRVSMHRRKYMNNMNYQQRMKQMAIRNNQTKLTRTTWKGIKNIFDFSRDISLKVISMFKTSVMSIKNMISFGTGLILLLVVTLFIGVFSSLSSDAGINSAIKPLNTEVINYRDTIERYAEQYDIEDYVSLIQAIMMVESEGKGNDPMQASEFPYNFKYPRIKDGIIDSDYSIEIGVHYFADCLNKAKVNDKTNIKLLSLALQGFEYGIDYIDWANINFGGYTRSNAQVYYEQVSKRGNPLYVQEVLQYYHLNNANIVLVAQTQIGNIGGEPYWTWYGFNERVEWCACFVSWCANEAGILNERVPKFAAVVDGIEWYKNKDLWRTAGHTPNPGDLIFFDWEQDGKSDHVGIVQKVEDGIIYTIEGNSYNECKNLSYQLKSKYIYGYGIS